MAETDRDAAAVLEEVRGVIVSLNRRWRPKAESTSRAGDIAFGYTLALDDLATALDQISATEEPK